MLDMIRSAALEGYIKHKYGAYLENNDFSAKLNTQERYLKICATLAGETSQTHFDIDEFEIVPADDGGKEKFLIVRKITCDKPWLQKLATDFLLDTPIQLPSFVASAL